MLDLLANQATPELIPPGYGWALAKMLVALLVVCVIAYLLLRFGLHRFTRPKKGSLLKLIEHCPISTNRSVSIIEAAGRFFLIGSGDGSVTMLAELAKEDLSRGPADAADSRRFAALLEREQRGNADDPPLSHRQEATSNGTDRVK